MIQAQQRRTVEFPILVYADGADWVAQCLLTSITAVSRDPRKALAEAGRLVRAGLSDGLRATGGDLDAALQQLSCPAPPDLWRRFFEGVRDLPSPRPPVLAPRAKARPRSAAKLRFHAREAASPG
jgi:hypothetical protein